MAESPFIPLILQGYNNTKIPLQMQGQEGRGFPAPRFKHLSRLIDNM
jgi:hypothetical protein